MESIPSTTLSLKRSVVTRLFRYSVTLDRLNWTARWAESVQSGEWCPVFETREQMYVHINNSLESGSPIDYLEFGVAAGDSLKSWCGIHSHPKSRFYGFDSFHGLPTDWKKGRPKGCFSTDGKPPEIDDPRVVFVPGLFQKSLPEFLAGYRQSSPIVIHNDSDLYSSTLFCLTTLDKLIVKNTIIIFDEFYDALHEYRALSDYCEAFQRSYKIVAATLRFNQVAIQVS
ncbi:MAG TPA: TylF/MycF/NovP-related O-methyltransferase [Candidatus Baltobacteraceae bacterium]|nr:TylF/MycF/NovP-related O-methyltransferase [Candidatus Baltobacteraceae bacterium]